MTNPQIIAENTTILIATGVIREDQIINTVPRWNKAGYRVKKGAEHVAEFPIWHPRTRKKDQTEEEFQEEIVKKGRFYMRMAYWFTNDQVEKK